MTPEEIRRGVSQIIEQAREDDAVLAKVAGGAFARILGTKFVAEKFVQQGGHVELNVIPFDAELTLAATTTFADGNFVLSNETDTFRLILGVGILLHDDGAAITNGPAEQLNTAGRLEIKRNTGKSRTWAFAALNLGPATPQRPDGQTTLITQADAQNMLPYAKLLPFGLAQHMQMPLDALVEASDKFTMRFHGLNGVTLDDSHSGLKAEAMAVCLDVVMGR